MADARQPTDTATRPAFVVGITGNMDPHPQPSPAAPLGYAGLEDRVRTLLHWIKFGARGAGDQPSDHHRALRALLGDASDAARLDAWPGVGPDTPVTVLSSLAPGADTIVARLVSSPEFQALGFTLVCPLPFPAHLDRNSSSFVRPPETRPDSVDRCRQDTFDQVLAGADHHFPVLLAEDVDPPAVPPGQALTPEHGGLLDAAFARDLTDPARCDRRYRAAGEYIAATSDLLIAVHDHRPLPSPSPSTPTAPGHLDPGAAAIVAAKRRGLTPGLLPITGGINWASNGPVFELFHPRLKNPEPAPATLIDKPLRIRHPYDLESPPATAGDDYNAQHAGNELLDHLGKNLHNYSTTLASATPCDSDPVTALCGDDRPPNAAGLRPLATAQADADAAATTLTTHTRKTLLRLLLLTLAAAFGVHVFAHWHTVEHVRIAAGDLGHFHADPLRSIIGGGALATGIAALVIFMRHRSAGREPRAHDYRALAEGLRVGFFWALAGLRRSVSANYMQRQRSELDWVRNAISSITSPSEHFQQAFLALPRRDQVFAFETVGRHWLGGQASYYRKRTRSYRDAVHFWHTLGGTLALAALVVLVVLIVEASAGLLYALTAAVGESLIAVPFVAVAVASLAYLFCLARRQKATPSAPLNRSFLPALQDLLHGFLPVPHGGERHRPAARPATVIIRNFLIHTLRGAVVATPVLALAATLPAYTEQVPDGFNLAIIFMGFLLVSGALSVAWAEKNLLSEQARQFAAMHQLYNSANTRLELLLETLRAADERGDVHTFHHARENVHELLFALGREALDENAEWLLLHRARPIEPVLPG